MNSTIRNSALALALAGGAVIGVTQLGGVANAEADSASQVIGVTTVAEAGAADGEQDERRGFRGQDGRRGGGPKLDAVAELFGLDPVDLRLELRSGSTLADIATANGVAVGDVVDLIVDQRTERIEQGVENGRITAEQAAERLDGLEERVTTRVNEGRPDRDDRTPAAETADAEG